MEVKNTESSYVGVGYTDCLGQKVGFVSSWYIDTSLQPYLGSDSFMIWSKHINILQLKKKRS